MAGTDEYMNAAVEEMEEINRDRSLRYQYLLREMAAFDEATTRNCYTNMGIKKGTELATENGIRILIETCKELGLSQKDTKAKVMEKFDTDALMTEQYLEKYWAK